MTDFGENYVKELRDKHAAVPDVRWHFIGTLQIEHALITSPPSPTSCETLAGERATQRLARRAARVRARRSTP